MAVKTYGKIHLSSSGEEWIIEAEPHVNLRLKDVFRQINKSKVKQLSLKNTDYICKDIEWFISRYPLEISPDDRALLTAGRIGFDSKQIDMESIFLPNYKAKSSNKLVLQLRNYQGQAVDLGLKTRRFLCGDDLGLGKTVVGIGVAIESAALPAMIVCQNHLTAQWKEEVLKFVPTARVHIIKSRKIYNLPEADFYIFSYSKIIGWDELIIKGFFKTTIFDEVQELRIAGSSKYTSCQRASERADYVVGLSATPVYNYGGEIYAVMNVLNKGCLGSWDEFMREWCIHAGFDAKVRVKDPKALGSYLRENFLMIRRTRKDVAKELPPVNKIIQEVEYNEDVANKAEAELKEIANRVLTGSFTERGQAARMLDVQARMMTGVAKARGVADFVKLIMESEERVLLVGWHREVYRIWQEELKEFKPVMYTGSETPAQKEESKRKFMQGESRLMIMSLRSGAGLNGLQEVCDTAIFGEFDWSPGVHNQVIGRLNRDGQEEGVNVTAIFCVTSQGTDPLMVDALGLKASQAHGIMNPTDEDVIETNFNEDRVKDLARQILENK